MILGAGGKGNGSQGRESGFGKQGGKQSCPRLLAEAFGQVEVRDKRGDEKDVVRFGLSLSVTGCDLNSLLRIS